MKTQNINLAGHGIINANAIAYLRYFQDSGIGFFDPNGQMIFSISEPDYSKCISLIDSIRDTVYRVRKSSNFIPLQDNCFLDKDLVDSISIAGETNVVINGSKIEPAIWINGDDADHASRICELLSNSFDSTKFVPIDWAALMNNRTDSDEEISSVPLFANKESTEEGASDKPAPFNVGTKSKHRKAS